MVHRLVLSYRGTAYAGWQRQANSLAVQQVVEEALESLLGRPIRVTGAGRTDAGVHARGQVAHFLLPRPIAAEGLVHGTNHHLPEDVRVMAAHRMADGFHARASAITKEYLYRWVAGAVVAPLDAPFAAGGPRPLDPGAIERALTMLVGRHDFSAFANAGGSHRSPMRRIHRATLEVLELPGGGRELRLRFVGDGFLRGMVRTLVGTLLQVGEGQRSVESFHRLLDGARREAAGATAPAQGLCLERVTYGDAWLPVAGYDGRAAEPSARRLAADGPVGGRAGLC